jgi:hypothetical protein
MPQVLVSAEAFGNGQDDGHVAPMVAGAQATGQARGLPADSVADKLFRADSHDQSEGNWATCAGEQLDASIPDPHCRARAPRFATQGRHQPPTAAAFTRADCPYDQAHDGDTCPAGKVLNLEARRHKIGHNLYRRYAADAADCHACPLRAKGLQHAETRGKHLAVYVEAAHATLSQQMIAKIDTPEAWKIDGPRLAIVEPVFGNIRSHKRLDRLTLRGKINVTMQWRLYCRGHHRAKLVHDGMAA